MKEAGDGRFCVRDAGPASAAPPHPPLVQSPSGPAMPIARVVRGDLRSPAPVRRLHARVTKRARHCCAGDRAKRRARRITCRPLHWRASSTGPVAGRRQRHQLPPAGDRNPPFALPPSRAEARVDRTLRDEQGWSGWLRCTWSWSSSGMRACAHASPASHVQPAAVHRR